MLFPLKVNDLLIKTTKNGFISVLLFVLSFKLFFALDV